jgi:tRNA pseudouridine38-40 synthase
VPARLDLDKMREAAGKLLGVHDFTTFRSVHCQSASPVKTLDVLDVEEVGAEVHIRAAARSFLHHQVRSMVGCLVMVGRGQWTVEDFQAALEAKDRSALGLNAPPHGLYFAGASYPSD